MIAFRKGIHDIIPQEVLIILTEQDIGLHLAGMPTMNIEELFEYATYDGYERGSETIKDLYSLMKDEWDDTMRANFLFFYSGSFKIPFEGFRKYKLKITRTSNTKSLPIGHTCFNQIELPDYKDKDNMRKKVEYAITEGYFGFHIS